MRTPKRDFAGPYAAQVGREVRSWMARREMTQKDLAERLGVTMMWLSRRLHGRQAFDVNELIAVAEALRCDLGDFLPEHEYHVRPIPTSVRERIGRDRITAGGGLYLVGAGTASGHPVSGGPFGALLPRLDSNQQPCD